MKNQAGKGPETRKGANFKAYWDNYPSIFRKSEEDKSSTEEEPKEQTSSTETTNEES